MEIRSRYVKSVLYIPTEVFQGNILIGTNRTPMICDFGIVRIFLEEGSTGMTTTSEHTGTDRYLAYELVISDEAVMPTMASDVYAVGCLGLEVRAFRLSLPRELSFVPVYLPGTTVCASSE